MGLEDIKEVAQTIDIEKVNKHLKKDWRLLDIKIVQSTHIERLDDGTQIPSQSSEIIYVMGRYK